MTSSSESSPREARRSTESNRQDYSSGPSVRDGSSLIKKFTKALIPPLQGTLAYLHSTPVSEDESSDYEDNSHNIITKNLRPEIPHRRGSNGSRTSLHRSRDEVNKSTKHLNQHGDGVHGIALPGDAPQSDGDTKGHVSGIPHNKSNLFMTTNSSRNSGEDDEEDYADLVGGSRPVSYFLNMVTTTSIYSGIGSISKLLKTYALEDSKSRRHKTHHLRHKPGNKKHSTLVGYGLVDTSEEESSTDEETEDDDDVEHRLHESLAKLHDSPSKVSIHSSIVEEKKATIGSVISGTSVKLEEETASVTPESIQPELQRHTLEHPTPTKTIRTMMETDTASASSISATSTATTISSTTSSPIIPTKVSQKTHPASAETNQSTLSTIHSSSTISPKKTYLTNIIDSTTMSNSPSYGESDTDRGDVSTIASFKSAQGEETTEVQPQLTSIKESSKVSLPETYSSDTKKSKVPELNPETIITNQERPGLERNASTISSDLVQKNTLGSATTLVTKRTTFQQSILDNLDPSLIKKGLLVKLKGEQGGHHDAEKLRLSIADKLQKVFDLSDDDYFYGNYSSWLIKDVLLQGHLYLTRECILFFAFLPKRYSVHSNSEDNFDDSNNIIQSGTLGMKTAKYGDSLFTTVLTHRYWAILRPETLSIYSSSTDLYFPHSVIDLKSCIRAEIVDKDKSEIVKSSPPKTGSFSGTGANTPRYHRDSNEMSDEEMEYSNVLAQEATAVTEDNAEGISGGVWVRVLSKKKTYKFYCDSLFSARQWCNNITKLIFQLNNTNEGDEVLIKIPIENVVDFGKNSIFDMQGVDIRGMEDEIPLCLSISYFSGDDNEEKIVSTGKMKRKLMGFDVGRKKTQDGKTPTIHDFAIESIYFLFFRDGFDCLEKIKQIVQDHKKYSDDHTDLSKRKSKSDKFLDKAKKIYRKDGEMKQTKSFSTLSSSDYSNTIVSQIASINNVSVPFSESSTTSPPRSISPTLTSISGGIAMKRLGRSLSSPAKIFSSKKSLAESPTSCTRSISDFTELDSPGSELSLSPSQQLSFPKPLTIAGLKNMQMSFETSHREVDLEASRYKQGDVTNSRRTSISSPSATNSIAETGTAKSISIPGPWSLRDPSEYNGDGKQTKLNAIGKSIKALSNVSNKWSAFPAHFVESGPDDPYYVKDKTIRESTERHYQEHFSLNSEKKLIGTYYAHLQRSIPVYGKVYLGDTILCFRSLLPGVSTKMILPLTEIETCYREKGLKLTYSGLVIVVHGQDELFLEFSSQKARDDCESMLLCELEKLHGNETWAPSPHQWGPNYELELSKTRLMNGFDNTTVPSWSESDLKIANMKIAHARIKMFEDKLNAAAGLDIPIILEDSPIFKTEVRPSTSYNFTLLTIGSRGDVQPYIALGKGLMKEGHNVTIATHAEFEDWIVKHGMKFKVISGNPAELMSLMVTHGSMSVAFLKEASSKFRGWITELLTSSWEACQGTDILIESPSSMGGVHIAEALGIPYLRAFTMPWTRTRAYPHAFIVPESGKGGSYNYLTHVMFETVFWKGISGQINKWRVKELGLPRTNLFRMQQTKIPFMYNVSPTIFPPAVDFPDWVKVTGYWFLDEGAAEDYDPPEELLEFIEEATLEGKKIVYIGFGSIVVKDARSLTTAIVNAVLDADVRCILNKGWSDRLTKDKTQPEIELPPEIYNSGAIPHDWLFPKIDAAVHHGGSGTTGATLRAGLPTIIKPFFGDQFFYANRVEEIGAGIGLKKLNAKSLSKALITVISDLKIIEKSKKISEKIRRENGVSTAIETIYSELEYARNLIAAKQQHNENYRLHHQPLSGMQTPASHDSDSEEYTDDEDEDEFDEDDSDEDGSGEDTDDDNDSEDDTDSERIAPEPAKTEEKEEEDSEEDMDLASPAQGL